MSGSDPGVGVRGAMVTCVYAILSMVSGAALEYLGGVSVYVGARLKDEYGVSLIGSGSL